jgi:hypothetical protein
VNSVTEAREKVLKYVSVMARPMVMYQNDHPIQWTPVYAGGKVRVMQKVCTHFNITLKRALRVRVLLIINQFIETLVDGTG